MVIVVIFTYFQGRFHKEPVGSINLNAQHVFKIALVLVSLTKHNIHLFGEHFSSVYSHTSEIHSTLLIKPCSY